MVRRALSLLAALLPVAVRSHAILSSPTPRPNMRAPVGAKLTPFADAKRVADGSCGGIPNSDPGVQTPTLVHRPGEEIQVRHGLTAS